MIEGKTKSGFHFKINEKVLDDYYFLEKLAEVDHNPVAFFKVMNMLFDPKQKKAALRHLEDNQGRVSVKEKLIPFIQEILGGVKEIKK